MLQSGGLPDTNLNGIADTVEYAIYGRLNNGMTSIENDLIPHNGVADIMDEILKRYYTSYVQHPPQSETKAFEDTDSDGIDDQLEKDIWGSTYRTSDINYDSDGDGLADIIEILLSDNLTSINEGILPIPMLTVFPTWSNMPYTASLKLI